MSEICLICQKNKKGTPIKEDFIVSSIRKIKRKLNIEKGNKIVICKDCEEEYVKRRKAYEGSMSLAIILTIVFFVALLFLSIFGGRVSVLQILGVIGYSLLIGLLLIGINLLRYVPATEIPIEKMTKGPEKPEKKWFIFGSRKEKTEKKKK